ncbi:MAG: hypothetical protein KatS3mg057_2215 [Herpetosiphonaceae bacterium]|nr:MAG: hypothetical protein KatS3mg057_2215 [Herpetosiphonaceae bacterium]
MHFFFFTPYQGVRYRCAFHCLTVGEDAIPAGSDGQAKAFFFFAFGHEDGPLIAYPFPANGSTAFEEYTRVMSVPGYDSSLLLRTGYRLLMHLCGREFPPADEEPVWDDQWRSQVPLPWG